MRTRRLAAVVGGSVLCVAALTAQDALAPLGVRPDQAKGSLLEALRTGRLYQQAAKAAFTAAPAPMRVTMVNGALS